MDKINWDKAEEDHDQYLQDTTNYVGNWTADEYDWKADIRDAIEDNKENGRKGFTFEYAWEDRAIINNSLFEGLQGLYHNDKYFTKKRIKKIMCKIDWWDPCYFRKFMYLICYRRESKQYQYVKRLINLVVDRLDAIEAWSLENQKEDEKACAIYYEHIIKSYDEAQMLALCNLCLWIAFHKYYEGVEADEGAVKEVKEILNFIDMLILDSPRKCAEYLSEHLEGWWD